MRNFRYITNDIPKNEDTQLCLTDHEIRELREDFDIETDRYYVITVLTKKEWEQINHTQDIDDPEFYYAGGWRKLSEIKIM